MAMDEHIRIYDPAIDWTIDTGTPPSWAATRKREDLRCKPGKTPIVFRCVRLSRRAYSWAMEAPSEADKLARAYRAGVRAIAFPDRTWTPKGADERTFVAMTEDEAEIVGIADVEEIGGLVLERSILPTDCEGGYTLRDTSRRVLAAVLRVFPPAAPSPVTPAQTPSEPAASSGG